MPASLFVAFPPAYDEASLNLFFAGLAAGFLIMLALIVSSKINFNKWWAKGGLRYESHYHSALSHLYRFYAFSGRLQSDFQKKASPDYSPNSADLRSFDHILAPYVNGIIKPIDVV